MNEGKSDDDGTPKFGFISGRRDRDRTFLEMVRVEGIFESAAAKLEWANRHIAELDRQSSEHMNAKWSFRLRADPLGGVRMQFDAPYRVPLRFGLMIGDIANNLRSTLDHIVWKVASPHVPDEGQQRQIQYPFASAKSSIREVIERKFVDRAGDAAVKIIEHYAAAINGLDQLNNDDKHRLTTPLSQVAEIRGFSRKAPPPKDYVAADGLLMGPLHTRDILTGGFPIGVDRHGAVDVSNFDMTLHLIFVDGPFSGQPAAWILRYLAQTAEAIVADFCKVFPSMFSPLYFVDNEDPL